MADINENPTTATPDLSVEDMVAKRAEITQYYEEHIPSLQTQLEYETLLRDIEKTRAERLQAQMFITKTMAEPPAAPKAPVAPPRPPVSPNMTKPSMEQAAKDFAKSQVETSKRVLKKKEDATK